MSPRTFDNFKYELKLKCMSCLDIPIFFINQLVPSMDCRFRSYYEYDYAS